MKRYALHFKNIAAVCMLFAILSLLLPFCKVTTSEGTGTLSGVGIIKVGMGLTKEYVTTKTIHNDYKVADHLTWGDIKSAASYAAGNQGAKQAIAAVGVAFLPVVFIGLAMIFTLFATGRISLFFPTLLTLFAVAENCFLIFGSSNIQSYLIRQAGGSGITLILLVGIYAFTVLSAIALFLLLMLYVTDGFDAPEEEEEQPERTKKKDSSKDNKRRKRRRRRRKEKRKTKKQKKEKKEANQESSRPLPVGASGKVCGLSGLYQGVTLDLSQNGRERITIGTTKEAKELLDQGTFEEAYQARGASCDIAYDKRSRTYHIVSHAAQELVLQLGDGKQQIRLRQDEPVTAGANSLLFVGDVSNIIRLE